MPDGNFLSSFLLEFLPVLGPLTWWCATTLGAALLCSSRAGSDQIGIFRATIFKDDMKVLELYTCLPGMRFTKIETLWVALFEWKQCGCLQQKFPFNRLFNSKTISSFFLLTLIQPVHISQKTCLIFICWELQVQKEKVMDQSLNLIQQYREYN